MRKNPFFWIIILFEVVVLYAFVTGRMSVINFIMLTLVGVLNMVILIMYYQKKEKNKINKQGET